MIFKEETFEVICDTDDKSFEWSLDLHTAEQIDLPFEEISDQEIKAKFKDFNYMVRCHTGKIEALKDNAYRLNPVSNRIQIDCTNGRK